MKKLTTAKQIMLASCVTLLMLTLNSCNKKMYFPVSAVAPAARGTVKVKRDNNNNYTIQVNVSDLAEVERLQGNKKAYVVWIITGNDNPKNMGQIKSGTKRFSKKLNADFSTVSPGKPDRIFITAEEDAMIQYPGNMVVLSRDMH
jgi:hypothetical protein